MKTNEEKYQSGLEALKKHEAKKKRVLSWLTKAGYFSIAVYFSICAIGWYS